MLMLYTGPLRSRCMPSTQSSPDIDHTHTGDSHQQLSGLSAQRNDPPDMPCSSMLPCWLSSRHMCQQHTQYSLLPECSLSLPRSVLPHMLCRLSILCPPDTGQHYKPHTGFGQYWAAYDRSDTRCKVSQHWSQSAPNHGRTVQQHMRGNQSYQRHPR